MNKRRVIIGLLGVALGVARLPVAWAAEEHEHHEDKAEKMPDTVAGIWSEVKQHEEELGKTIADKKLDKVHEVAFEIRDMVNALPDKSKDLPADKLAKLKANAKFVADLAKRLDESGDANDQAATEANFKKLQGIVKTIEAQYPPEILKASESEKARGYTCSMCGGSFDKPGKCPKCGMNLVEKKTAPHSEIQPHRDHAAKNGGMFTMVGDSHLELVERDNEFRVFVYDAYTKPVSVADLRGKLEFEGSSGEKSSLDLLPTADGAYLVAVRAKGVDPAEATIRLPFRGENLMVTLPLRVTFKGRIVDMACFARDGMAALDSSHDDCARACIAAGSPIGLLVGDSAGSTPYLITMHGDGTAASKSANEKLLSLVNKHALITGKLVERNNLKIVELTDVQPD